VYDFVTRIPMEGRGTVFLPLQAEEPPAPAAPVDEAPAGRTAPHRRAAAEAAPAEADEQPRAEWLFDGMDTAETGEAPPAWLDAPMLGVPAAAGCTGGTELFPGASWLG
jgi:hypothetical protein